MVPTQRTLSVTHFGHESMASFHAKKKNAKQTLLARCSLLAPAAAERDSPRVAARVAAGSAVRCGAEGAQEAQEAAVGAFLRDSCR